MARGDPEPSTAWPRFGFIPGEEWAMMRFATKTLAVEEPGVFEQQYDDEMVAEILRLEARKRAAAAGHPEWENACAVCGGELPAGADRCDRCAQK